MPRPSVSEISSDLASRIEALAQHLYPAGHRDGLEWRVGSVQGESGDSLAIHLGQGDKRGTWKDFATGEGGDPVDLVRARFNLATVGEAVAWAKDWLGIGEAVGSRQRQRRPERQAPVGSTAESPQSPGPEELRKQSWARDIWHKSRPAAGTVVETYLRSRGITIAVPDALRFNPSLKHTAAGTRFPGMVAEVTLPDGTFMAVHRTYLARDGRSKAFSKGDPHDAKMSLGAVSGGAIHLGPASERLAICEGIETGLSVRQVWPELPVWAALSSSGLTAVRLPDPVRSVLILADADAPDELGRHPGQDAARRAARRFSQEGRTVMIALPPEGKDWNDLLVEGTLGMLLRGQPEALP